jgi:hypothetical protein
MTRLENKTIYLTYTEDGYQKYLFIGQKLTYGLKNYGTIDSNPFWPKNLGIEKQKHKPATYWPQEYRFFYLMNRENKSAVFATNSLLNKNWLKAWTYTNLKDSKNIVFTAMFWWKYNNAVFVVGEEKFKPRNGFIYDFDYKRDIPLSPTVNRNEFLF